MWFCQNKKFVKKYFLIFEKITKLKTRNKTGKTCTETSTFARLISLPHFTVTRACPVDWVSFFVISPRIYQNRQWTQSTRSPKKDSDRSVFLGSNETNKNKNTHILHLDFVSHNSNAATFFTVFRGIHSIRKIEWTKKVPYVRDSGFLRIKKYEAKMVFM